MINDNLLELKCDVDGMTFQWLERTEIGGDAIAKFTQKNQSYSI